MHMTSRQPLWPGYLATGAVATQQGGHSARFWKCLVIEELKLSFEVVSFDLVRLTDLEGQFPSSFTSKHG